MDDNAATYAEIKDAPQESFKMDENKCYSRSKVKTSPTSKDSGKGKIAKKERLLSLAYFNLVFIVVITLVLAVISVCAITGLVQIAALQQNVSKKTQNTDITPDTNSEVITGVMQNLSQLFFEVQQLRAELQSSSFISSCSSLPPSCPSDYYRLRVSNGSVVRVYRDMTLSCGNITGGWMRVAEQNTTNSRQQCPDGLMERADGRCAAPTVDGCPSVFFSTQKINYTNVCGRITAYQVQWRIQRWFFLVHVNHPF